MSAIPKGLAVMLFDAIRASEGNEYHDRAVKWFVSDAGKTAEEAESIVTEIERLARSCSDAEQFHRLMNFNPDEPTPLSPREMQLAMGGRAAVAAATTTSKKRSTFGWHAPSY
jgi:hypothetical protein